MKIIITGLTEEEKQEFNEPWDEISGNPAIVVAQSLSELVGLEFEGLGDPGQGFTLEFEDNRQMNCKGALEYARNFMIQNVGGNPSHGRAIAVIQSILDQRGCVGPDAEVLGDDRLTTMMDVAIFG